MAARPAVVWRSRAALGLAAGVLLLGAWTWIPAPTYAFLILSVGAPELSPWLATLALGAIALAAMDARRVRASRAGVVLAALALVAPATVLLRLPFVLRDFDAALANLPNAAVSRVDARPALSARALFFGLSIDGVEPVSPLTVAAANGVRLALRVHRPSREGRFPVVLQIYGGAWHRGSPDDDAILADALSSDGYVVLAIDYRHAPEARWPAQLDDVRASIAWAQTHAAEYGGDASRLVMLGRSSGSQLAIVSALTAPTGTVRAIVLNYSPVDLADGYRHPGTPDTLHLRQIEGDLFGGSVDQVPDAYRDASPLTYADRPHPPVLLINGGRDRIVYPSYAETLYAHLHASGDATLLVIPWADHAFDAVPFGPSAQIELTYTRRFLAWALR